MSADHDDLTPVAGAFSAADQQVFDDILHALRQAEELEQVIEDSKQALRVLIALAEGTGLSFGDLSREAGLKDGSLARIIERLDRLVASGKDPDDRRVSRYFLTPDGLELMNTVIQRRRQQLRADRLRPAARDPAEPEPGTQAARATAGPRRRPLPDLDGLVSAHELFAA